MKTIVATRTDVGRVRTNNEDAFFADAELGLYMVCDGMGGHSAGEVASQSCCDIVLAEIKKTNKLREKYSSTGDTRDISVLSKAVESAVQTACKEVFKKANRHAELSGMGTTCTIVLLLAHNKGIVAHVGDSRLYMLRGGRIHQLSEDHTFVNELVKRGAISSEQARNHPQGNVLSRALGVQSSITVDTMIFDVDPGDIYLLCSDGLYNYYPNAQEIIALLSPHELQGSLNQLIDGALQRGGHDNVTAVAFAIDGEQPPTDSAEAAEQRITVLKAIPFFAHLSYNELVKVVGLTRLLHVPTDQVFIREGEPGHELFVLLAGEVDVSRHGELIASLQPGAHIGEMALIDNAVRSATIKAKTDVSLLCMRREEFFSVVRHEPVVATKLLWSFIQVLNGRLRDTNEALQGVKKELFQQNDDVMPMFVEEDKEDS